MGPEGGEEGVFVDVGGGDGGGEDGGCAGEGGGEGVEVDGLDDFRGEREEVGGCHCCR